MNGEGLAKLIQPPADGQASTAARPRGTMATVCYGAPGEFNTSAWAVDSEGNAFVVDTGNNRMNKDETHASDI